MADKNGNKTGGRAPNTLNKRTEEVIETINRLGITPVEYDAHVLNWNLEELGFSEEQIASIEPEKQLELRANASGRLSPILYPRLKAIEHSGGISNDGLFAQMMGEIDGSEQP